MQYVVYGSLILYFGRNFLIPLSFALLISFILYPICAWLEKKKMGRGTAIALSLLLLFFLAFGVVLLMATQLIEFLSEWPEIRSKLSALINDASLLLSEVYSVSKEKQQHWLNNVANGSASQVVSFLGSALSASSFAGVMLVLVPIYAALILYYRHVLVHAAAQLFPGERKEETKRLLLMASTTYYNFIKGMGLVYLIVGILNCIGLLLIGVPHAIFFGLAASVLTFIPYFGIMVGSLLPVTMAWLTFGSVWYPLGVIFVFTFVQYLEANVIFPLAVSNRLQLNPLSTLLAIALGGLLWGVSGMILFVPFLAILKLIADKHPSMKMISLLTGTGNNS